MHIFYWWDLWTRRKRIEEGENENRWSISLSLKSKKAVKQNKLNYFESLFQSEEKNIFRKKKQRIYLYMDVFLHQRQQHKHPMIGWTIVLLWMCVGHEMKIYIFWTRWKLTINFMSMFSFIIRKKNRSWCTNKRKKNTYKSGSGVRNAFSKYCETSRSINNLLVTRLRRELKSKKRKFLKPKTLTHT